VAPGLLDRRLLFVTGKGGVGKTAISTALASLSARRGKRTLLCEVDAKGDVARLLETGPTGFEPREVEPNLFAMTLTTEESLREYLKIHLRVPLVGRIGPLARTFDFVADAAPGVREILTVGKVAFEVREDHYDLVVVDAAATGHVVAQLGAPDAISELVRVGRVRDQVRWMREILEDPARTGVVVVTTPEETPVRETIDLVDRIGRETKVPLAAVVANRVLPELFGRREEERFEELRSDVHAEALVAALRDDGVDADRREVDAVFDAAELAVTLRRARAEHLTTLRASIDDALPVLFVPELFARAHGARATTQIAAALADEVG
jgi:anion-transporting  ArsA/GET3 family ATPase